MLTTLIILIAALSLVASIVFVCGCVLSGRINQRENDYESWTITEDDDAAKRDTMRNVHTPP